MAIIGRPIVWREHWTAVAILGTVIMLVYGDIAFMGYTLSPALWNWNVLIPPFGYHGRWLLFPNVLDPLATGSQNWPAYVLIAKMIRSGQLPLWNPYQGTGAPLAADPSWSTYFPFDLLYVFLGNQYWDYVWLLKLWTAGILAYLLLKRMGLGFSSAIGGGLAYCLSGAFIWSPFMNWTNVAILTPALLLVVVKCFDKPFAASVIVGGSFAFAIALLGAHLESLLIQFSYVFLFVIFEIATRRNQRKMLGAVTWAITILLGIGLAAFFLVPLQEYSGVAVFFHGPEVGIASFAGHRLVWWVGLFVPYLYGFLQTYFYAGLKGVAYWDISPGYIGVCVLFLSLLPFYPIIRGSVRFANSKYYFFFLATALLILLKIFGISPINWIGLLPGFQYIDFPRYSGSVLTMSFAGAGAYGIELVLRKESRNVCWPTVLFVLAAIFPAALSTIATIPGISTRLSPPGAYFPVSVAYLALAMYYVAISAYVAAKGGADAAKTLVALLVLELVSYVPRSLTVQYEAVRVCVLAGAGLLLVVGTRIKNPLELIEPFRCLSNMRRHNQEVLASPTKETLPGIIPMNFMNNVTTRRNFMATVIIAALILQFSISAVAPNGIPQRYDPYTTPPYVKFLQANLGYQRAYSPDGLFFPPSAGVYALQNLGEFSALMPSSFSAFSKANLDREAVVTTLVGNAYVRQNSTINAQSEIRDNIAFYSLLGVKYFVTSYSDIGTVSEISIQPESENDYAWAPVGSSTVSSSFVTDVPFDALTLRIGTYDRTNLGAVRIVMDAVPFNMSLHRESSIDATSIINGAPNKFSFELLPIAKKTKFVISISQSDTRKGNEVAILCWFHVKANPDLYLLPGSLNIALGLALLDPTLPLVYHDVNATIYENLRVFSRAFLVGHVVVASDDQDAILKTKQLGWETRNTTVIEGMPQDEVTAIDSAVGEPGDTSIEQYSPASVSIRAVALRTSLLVLTDTYFPGWRAYLDGTPVPTYRTYGLVRGIFIPPGPHQVLFKYEPTSFEIGVIISILSGAVLSFLVCSSAFRPKRKHMSSSR